jgi:hypothetical protein
MGQKNKEGRHGLAKVSAVMMGEVASDKEALEKVLDKIRTSVTFGTFGRRKTRMEEIVLEKKK